MLIQQFILQNSHFALNVFGSLVFFSVSWLYLDAYFTTKSKKELFKILGFSLLSLSFLIHATHIEQVVISSTIFSGGLIELASNTIKFIAYIFIILGLILDPIQQKPQNKATLSAAFLTQSLPAAFFYLSFPVLSFIAFILFLRQATTGLERHLKPQAIGFLFIFLYETLSLSKLLENTGTVFIYKIVKPFGPLWILEHIFLLIGFIIIARWIFGYLLKRIQTQLFVILNISVLIIFLITTVCFTGLLLNNLRQDALSHLETDVNVIKYAISLKQNQTLSDAELVSQNPEIISAVSKRNRTPLKNLTTSILLSKKESYLIIVASGGAVLMRGEDNEKVGDSLSNDPLYLKAARGEKVSTITSRDGPIAPVVSIRSASPIISSGQIIGVSIVGTDIDNAFVDGLKSSTRLDISVYGGKTLSSTTFVAEDGKSRFVGIKEENKDINKNVLIEGKNYSLETNILNTSYFASFAPLKDVDGNPVGMLFAGKEQVSVIQAASKSIEYTFFIASILILISVIASYFLSKFIANQFK